MIRLKSYAEALALLGKIPELAVSRMKQFEGDDGRYDPEIHGHIVVWEEGDDIADLPEIGPDGLLGVIDDEWRAYEYVEVFTEEGRKVYEMVVQIDDDKTVAVIIPDCPWLDERLRLVLEAETGA